MKTIVGVILLSLFTQLNAQENKNNWMINGNMDFFQNDYSDANKSHFSSSKNKLTYVYTGSNLGYFITNNFAVGILNQYYSNTNTNKEVDTLIQYTVKEKMRSYTTGVYARYNHMINKRKFGFFLQLETDYTWQKYNANILKENSNEILTRSSTGYSVSLTPGLVYFINHKFSVETSLGNVGFNSFKGNDFDELDMKQNQINFYLTTRLSLSSINFGFTYYFGGNKPLEKKNNE